MRGSWGCSCVLGLLGLRLVLLLGRARLLRRLLRRLLGGRVRRGGALAARRAGLLGHLVADVGVVALLGLAGPDPAGGRHGGLVRRLGGGAGLGGPPALGLRAALGLDDLGDLALGGLAVAAAPRGR